MYFILWHMVVSGLKRVVPPRFVALCGTAQKRFPNTIGHTGAWPQPDTFQTLVPSSIVFVVPS